MRARFSDMMNLVDFTADSFEHDGLPGGFVEAKVTRTKSAHTLERKTMYLPMTAPRCCVTGLDWFSGWQHAKLVAPGAPSFPALSNQEDDKHVSIDSAGTVKVRDKESKIEADVSTDMMVRMALMRRGLALDQCNISEKSFPCSYRITC